MMLKKKIISAQDLSIGYFKSTYGHDAVLYSGLSLNLYSGELTCLLGQNGSGKSTLLRTLSAVQPALSGDIILDGENLKNYSDLDLSYKIGLVLTDKTSVGGFKVFQLVALGRYPYTGFWGKLTKQDKEIVEAAMRDVGIIHKSDSYVAELSDGERQKVMIAKALAQQCPIVFLDEPTAFLDVASRIEIMNLLHDLAQKQNKAILLSTHDVELALLLADRMWLLSRDGGLKCGVTEDILLSKQMECFLSRDNIAFDMQSGSFYPRKTFTRFVCLDADNDIYRWVKNFLMRNSWGITSDKNEAQFSIKIVSINDIQIAKDGEVISLSSFEKLSEWLFLN